MSLFNQSFEYLTHTITCPTSTDFESFDYDSKEYKSLEVQKRCWNILLDRLGEAGWELIAMDDDPSTKNKYSYKRCFFKRSSRSKYFGSGFGVNLVWVQDLAEEQAKQGRFELE